MTNNKISAVNKFIPLILVTVLWLSIADAQETDSALPEEVAVRMDVLVADITSKKQNVELMTSRMDTREGVAADLLMLRREQVWSAMLQDTVALAELVVEQRNAGRDVSAYWTDVVDDLSAMPDEILIMLERVRSRARDEFATDDLNPKDFVISDQRFFADIEAQDDLFEAMIAYVSIAGEFGLDASEVREFLVTEVAEHAASVSMFLTRAQSDAATYRSAAATAGAMQSAVARLDELGLESRFYRQQLLTTTGEITTDVLDVGLVAEVVREWGGAVSAFGKARGPQLLFRALLIALILFVFWQLGKLLRRLLVKALSSARVSVSALLQDMIVSTARNIVFGIGILIAISQMGVSLGPLLAGLGIAGFIIGFALQDTLSNFASGVMILIYRPFDVGDFVEAGGVQGKVSHMSLVNTTFLTLDNQRLIVPNNMIWQTVITNVTAQHMRRVDLVFGVSYDDDLEKVEKLLHEIVNEHEAVLSEPEPMIKLHELAESSVNFIVRKRQGIPRRSINRTKHTVHG